MEYIKKHCEDINCKNYFSCNMMLSRFGVKECEEDREAKVNKVHLKELQDREVLLKGLSE